MNHLKEEELIAYRDGEEQGRTEATAHLAECPECREELARIDAVFAALDAMPVPNPGTDYERRVWQRLEPRLPEKRAHWWEGLFAARRLAVAGAMAALILAAYFTGIRVGKTKTGAGTDMAGAEKVRERVLVVAVGEHLGKSEMVLVELANAEPPKGEKLVNISPEQKRAEALVEENRLYRQTALKEGDQAMASTLDELERVLLDIANSPDEITPAQFESLQKRIEAKGILFKVRVVNQDLREREKNERPSPAQGNSEMKERNKA
ncbi:MAG TPA: hypothetical protein VMH31_08630 [Methylomirabilota bacterium]|nr:hypothetical protein [Methylomirabilota bacterium]